MSKIEKYKPNIEMIPPNQEVDENRERESDQVAHETTRLIRTLTSRVREIVGIIILLIALFSIIYGMIVSLFKHSNPTSAMEDSLKLLNAINTLQGLHGAFAIPNLGALQSNQSWNMTAS